MIIVEVLNSLPRCIMRVSAKPRLLAIHEIFASNATQFPSRPCVIETKSPRHPERVFTYKQINEASNQLAHHFLAKGCERGDVVVIYAYRG